MAHADVFWTDDHPAGLADIRVADHTNERIPVFHEVPIELLSRTRWWPAYRAARLALRDRAALAALKTYEPDRKACNAGLRVTKAVFHALNLDIEDSADARLGRWLSQAARIALGEPQAVLPGRLNNKAWMTMRALRQSHQRLAA
jgi:hypothetical protein